MNVRTVAEMVNAESTNAPTVMTLRVVGHETTVPAAGKVKILALSATRPGYNISDASERWNRARDGDRLYAYA